MYGIGVRATLLLRKGEIDDKKSYRDAIQKMLSIGYDNITSWPVGNPDGTRNKFTPSRLGLLGIRWWLKRNAKLCHGHVWGGGVYVSRHDPKSDFVRQLVVFQDATVSYSWIRDGALCLK